MFDVGFSELLLIFVVSLLVVGPERLPGLARKLGLYLGKLRRTFQDVKREVEQELEIEAVKEQLKENALKTEAENLKQGMDDLAEDLNKTIHPPASSVEKD